MVDNKVLDQLHAAREMFEIFSNSLGVTDEGLKALSDHFGEVPAEDRAAVFTFFLQMLDVSGIPYDTSSFNY